MTKINRFTVYLLLLAGALWGFGFVATVWGLKTFSSTEFLFFRYSLASTIGFIFYFLKSKNKDEKRYFWNLESRFGFIAGVILTCVLWLQTEGLRYTTAGKSAFITTLYVVLIPFLSFFLKHFLIFLKAPQLAKKIEANKPSIQFWIFIILALLGTFLLSGSPSELSQFNRGDLLTLACALFASFHIIYIGLFANQSKYPFWFNHWQSVWSSLFLGALLLIERTQTLFEGQMTLISKFAFLPAVGIFFTSVGSTLIAFTIQVYAQKKLNATVASIAFLLESPFALLFGYLFLNERITAQQFIGALLILIVSIFCIRIPNNPTDKYTAV